MISCAGVTLWHRFAIPGTDDNVAHVGHDSTRCVGSVNVCTTTTRRPFSNRLDFPPPSYLPNRDQKIVSIRLWLWRRVSRRKISSAWYEPAAACRRPSPSGVTSSPRRRSRVLKINRGRPVWHRDVVVGRGSSSERPLDAVGNNRVASSPAGGFGPSRRSLLIRGRGSPSFVIRRDPPPPTSPVPRDESNRRLRAKSLLLKNDFIFYFF